MEAWIISVILNVVLLVVILILAFKVVQQCNQNFLNQLAAHWKQQVRPPSLEDNVVVYVSAPLFNLSETIYAIGIKGIMPDTHISLVDTLCNLSPLDIQAIEYQNKLFGLPEYGIAGSIAQKGWKSYIPARDGFVLQKFLTATFNSEDYLTAHGTTPGEVASYLSKAIYAFDVFALSSLCNCCVFNANGLQIDDGSAAEIGMIGVRGMPAVYLRNQATDQFGPGASNPMPLGNANSIINQKAFTVDEALLILGNKIKNIIDNKDNWWAGLDYTSKVCPPPLIMFWIEIGEAVFNVRYKTRLIVTDPKTGFQDYKASSTDFFYSNYYKNADGSTAGSNEQLVTISIKIMQEIKKVEDKWKSFILTYGGCDPQKKVLINGCY